MKLNLFDKIESTSCMFSVQGTLAYLNLVHLNTSIMRSACQWYFMIKSVNFLPNEVSDCD